jgi:2-keto-4-pentenoate hydratase/2-oxohepta-3-ene-1,7-dioic acid hydratase in catechol pathway
MSGRPSKIVCVGRNYADHARELGNEVPSAPLLFLKPPSAIIGNGERIILPPASERVEFEAEIGVVIGRRMHRALAVDAERGIQGFVCLNDVTARDLQKSDGQWSRAKGFDTFCPVGPRIAEGLDWRSLEVIGRVNGEERQRAPSSAMVFSIPDLLRPGDVVEVEIPGVGVLRNPVEAWEE